jgi:tetratricopeptide (TPR) repeat protein
MYFKIFMSKGNKFINHNMFRYKNLSLLYLILFASAFFLFSCTKEVPKEMLNSNKQAPMSNQNMPNDSIHRNLMKSTDQGNTMGQVSTNNEDPKADELTKEADEADAKYQKTKSVADKKAAVEKQMAAANYLMFDADLTPKKKYRPALKRYRRVLELDPSNQEAAANKKQIEDIYQQMGMPIPE